jgi:thiosulfate dehydrogenase [quinone] large subunit
MSPERTALTGLQQGALVLLRTLVGWHLVYEGLYKLWLPAWSRDGVPLARWTSAGYLRGASGPLAEAFHAAAGSRLVALVDGLMPVALLLVGLSLLLGLLTRLGALGALGLLGLFYLSAIPTAGVHQAGAEGAYLIVNKNLNEAAAVLVLLGFDTGRLAGLDLLLRRTTPARGGSGAGAQAEGASA